MRKGWRKSNPFPLRIAQSGGNARPRESSLLSEVGGVSGLDSYYDSLIFRPASGQNSNLSSTGTVVYGITCCHGTISENIYSFYIYTFLILLLPALHSAAVLLLLVIP